MNATTGPDRALAISRGAQRNRQRTESRNSESTASPEALETTAGTTTSGPSAGSEGSGEDDDPAEAEPEPELPLDQVFEILKNSRRRQTLHYLFENGGTASLSDLAEHIAAIENDIEVRAITSSQRKRVYVGLYQCHLPKMDGMDIIDFEKNRGTVEIGPNAERLKPYIEQSEELAWDRLYAGVTVGATALFGLSMLGVPSAALTPTAVLVAFLAVMLACTAVHSYYGRIIEYVRRPVFR